jgi:hypothetical protein
MAMNRTNPYGYFSEQNDSCRIRMKQGQNMAGFPIGIIFIETVWYPYVPGNVANGYTYPFPVRLEPVRGLTCQALFDAASGVEEKVLEACIRLEKAGVRAISGACGFFGHYQKQIAGQLSVPVALSSLLQIPWILPLIKSGQRIGVLTAQKDSLTDALLENCGVTESMRERLIIRDLGREPEFSAITEGRGSFDNGAVRDEVVSKAVEIVREDPAVGAFLLECSDMPPYAYAVQAATGKPVYDFITMIRWLCMGVTQTPYCGFL